MDQKKINRTITGNEFRKPSDQAYGRILSYFVLFFSGLQIIKEFLQLFGKGLRYFSDPTNYLEWVIIGTTWVYMAGSILGLKLSDKVKFENGIVCIFLGWLNVTLFLQRIPMFGLLISMFVKVIKTLVLVLFGFGVIILAFALTFNQLFIKEKTFSSVPKSLMKTFVMFLGEMDYESFLTDSLSKKDSSSGFPLVPYSDMAYVVLFVFLIMISIGLMNLLVSKEKLDNSFQEAETLLAHVNY